MLEMHPGEELPKLKPTANIEERANYTRPVSSWR